ncbi:hypothetical protein SAMN05421771_2280 [Granulicella pectinivorans]|jgi:hypothetical protein|uniref:MetA-pathway of phenol degradation n=1 Tax=Granulicella pectinivorans TaxID=474950 RepID=A0A1I6MC73_9BACT|nr:hypothetical protein [Granulicella pectinivorans]SFS13350.1 hypothetical protein SAMN05421771_2280 [Granulicella pectinivorans]
MKVRFLLGVLLAASVPALAQSHPRAMNVSVAEQPAAAKNPTFLFRTVSLGQEWDRKYGGNSLTTSLGYVEPLRHASMSIGVSVPFAEATGHRGMVLGDAALKSQWIPYVRPRQGVLLTGTLRLPTAQDKDAGSGDLSLTPSVAYARFWGPRFLLAQFVQQQVSAGGWAGRSRVNRTDLDLYSVYSGRSLQWWINGDVNLRVDEAHRNAMSSTVTLSYGRGLKKAFGGQWTGSVQAGGGVGPSRPYGSMVTGGIALVGFGVKR